MTSANMPIVYEFKEGIVFSTSFLLKKFESIKDAILKKARSKMDN